MRFILFGCSREKQSGGMSASKVRKHVSAVDLLGPDGEGLASARRALNAALVDRDNNTVTPADASLMMPAVQRYVGPFYEAAGLAEWPRAQRRLLESEALIVSGLYGVVTTEEAIKEYDVWMGRKVEGGLPVWSWWSARGLGVWLRRLLARRKVTDLHVMLPSLYRHALGELDFSGTIHLIGDGESERDLEQQGQALKRLVFDGRCSCGCS